jgi:hypothetical protein
MSNTQKRYVWDIYEKAPQYGEGEIVRIDLGSNGDTPEDAKADLLAWYAPTQSDRARIIEIVPYRHEPTDPTALAYYKGLIK